MVQRRASRETVVEENPKEAPLVFQALQEPLLAALQATDTQPPVVNEKLSWGPFVNLVVYYFVSGIKSGRLLITHLHHANPALGLPTDLKKSTFFEAFRRFSPTQARQLFYSLLSSLAFFPVEEMSALGILCGVDGSHWPAFHCMTWAVVGRNKPTVLFHLAFGLNQMIPVSVLMTESNSSERSALRKMIQAGVTYIADRGYFAFSLLHDIANALAFFVIRARCNVKYTVIETLPVNLPAGLTWLIGVEDLKVECGTGKDKGTWRVVRFTIGNSLFILFTNRWELTTWQIITIYAYRWQIELFFLFAKRTLNGLHLLTLSRNGLEIQFYLLLVSALLLLNFKQRNDSATEKDTPTPEPVQVPLPIPSASESSKCAEDPVQKPPETEVPGSSPGEENSEEEGTHAQETAQTMAKPVGEAPTSGEETFADPTDKAKASSPKVASSRKGQPTQPTRQGTVAPGANAQWYRNLGQKLRTFWRISIHWLQALRDNLANVWDPPVFKIKPGLYVPKQ